MKKILTVCRQGLSRSVGLADILKLHFEPVDVISAGYFANTKETLEMIIGWADIIVVMEPHMVRKLTEKTHDNIFNNKHVLVCDVGPDVYGHSIEARRRLIDQVWQWSRINMPQFGITEHNKRL